jgi:soluble lytic murein transglycosylase
LGADVDARRFYEAAAEFSITYYGQLARAKLGLPEVQLRSISAADRTSFEARPMAQTIRRLYDAGYRDLAFTLCGDLAAGLTDAGQLDALAHLAAEKGDARTLLAIGKTAVQRGYPLDLHAFPLLGVPPVELFASPSSRPWFTPSHARKANLHRRCNRGPARAVLCN